MDTAKLRITQTGNDLVIADELTGKPIANVVSCNVSLGVDEPAVANVEVLPESMDFIALARLGDDQDILLTRQMVIDWLQRRTFVTTGDRYFVEQLISELQCAKP